jgi:hypothetical protein
MEAGTRQKKRRSFGVLLSGLALFLMLCLCLAACGSSQVDHPLTAGTPIGEQGSPVVNTATPNSGFPIVVSDSQSTLTMYPGGFMTLTVTTNPYAVCNFTVYYGLSTPSKTYGIVPRTADANGIASWHWQVDGQAHTGAWPLSISATLPNGGHASTKVNVDVTLPPINVGSPTNLSGTPGSDLMLTIQTAPSVNCSLLLNFGPSIQSKTLTVHAGSAGTASWSWHVNKQAPPGTWPLTITVTLADGESSSSAVNMTILPG